MKNACAACRRAAATAKSGRAICASCSWLEARSQSQPIRQESAPPRAAVLNSGDVACDVGADDIMLDLLFGLAPIVGERGSDVVQRVLRGVANGSLRAYQAELNRLAGKFIASLERLSWHHL
ncbi:MAG: hypothetical protein C5B57_01080 [Blastocatellia bacterium]|nr:MAG: hypothetical protein C5B57_01080 [Blastocatellia bacterium]